MILPALALGMQLVMPIAAAGRVPQLDVEPVCKGIAEQGGVNFRDPAVAQEKRNCIEREQVVREQVAKQWSSFLPTDRTHCVNETMMGGQSSYTELLTCLEMARDARAMRVAAAASRQAAATSAPSSSSPRRGEPTLLEPAVTPSSANEPPKRQIDSTLKELELERAKKDAENATASEALARRKLADLEAALQRAREEAGQASKDAERAKADAELARELQAQAERHFAEAAAARIAAEGREQACQSATKQPSLGARIRGWLKRSSPTNQ
jgi:hypothetical protein